MNIPYVTDFQFNNQLFLFLANIFVFLIVLKVSVMLVAYRVYVYITVYQELIMLFDLTTLFGNKIKFLL